MPKPSKPPGNPDKDKPGNPDPGTPPGPEVTSGTTYYVSVGGSDSNNGTSTSTPWQTMAKIYNGSPPYSPGDIICLKRGDLWNEQLYLPPVSGTAGNPITYTAYGTGGPPIVNGPGGTGFGLDMNNLSHIVISNIQFQNWNNDGVMIAGNCVDISIEDVISTLNTRHGFCAEATLGSTDQENVRWLRCEAYRNGNAGFIASTITGAGPLGIRGDYCKSTYSGQAVAGHGLSAYFASNVHWNYCEAAYTNINPITGMPNAFTTEGIGIAFDDHSGNGSATYNYSHHNQGPGIAAGHIASNNEISYNKVANNGNDGVVINGFGATSDNILVFNNTIVYNTGHGCSVQQPSAGAQFKNNLIAYNTGYGIAFTSTGVTSYTVANNLLFTNTLGATANVTGVTGTITGDPLLDASYVPAVGSPAINAGLTLTNNLGLDPSSSWPLSVTTLAQSGAWDIGAYVYVAAAAAASSGSPFNR